jgi:6,7-dimethyl-8-ribityllumazine synthase
MAEPRRSAVAIDDAAGARLLVVEARYYEEVSEALWQGAKAALDQARVIYERVEVPGALEIPQAIVIAVDAAALKGRPYEGIVALGCVIRGETSHYDIVANESAHGLMDIAVHNALPIGNGILTVDTQAQALARAGGDKLDKGGDAVRAALSLIAIRRRLTKR